jgi:alpha-tubulin suppressor-like RCC1 family protein
VQVSGLSGVITITAGQSHTIALKSDGTVWDWGHNSNGQLGNNSTTDSHVPIETVGIVPLPDTDGVAPVMTFTDPGNITILL